MGSQSFVAAASIALAVIPRVASATSGLAHSPQIFVDEATSFVYLLNQSGGYRFDVTAEVSGLPARSPVRVDWTSGGRVVATVRCRATTSDAIYANTAHVSCEYRGTPIRAVGAIDAKLIVTDDADSHEYVIRDFNVTAAGYHGDRSGPIYQLVPDDLLGTAYAVHLHGGYASNGQVGFNFWFSGQTVTRDATMRCTVDGHQLNDIEAQFEDAPNAVEIQADLIPASGPRKTYRWNHVQLRPRFFYYGTAPHPSYLVLGDHAGAWSCDVRKDHEVLRTLVFTVGADGMIQSSAMQQGTGAVPLVHDVAWIEMKIPGRNKIDGRIRPAAMRRTRGYGLPWPSAPAVTAQQNAFPGNFGTGEP